MDKTTQAIVAWAEVVRSSARPPDTVTAAKRKLADSIACALGGLNSPPARIARRLAAPVAGKGAGVFGASHCSTVDAAGLRTAWRSASWISTTLIPAAIPATC